MSNIVIYGGGFDPIHNGHINMALNASKALDAEVFFVPARISVWKEESGASGIQKLEMIDLVIKETGNSHLHVSDYEIKTDKETNYSIDTIRHFKTLYPNDKLYLLVGTDQVEKFEYWKECDEIAKLATVVMFNRPGYKLNEANIKRFKVEIIEGEMVDASSTEIRMGQNLRTPLSVINYIVDHELYFVARIKALLSEHRYLHSVSVARLAYDIAKANNEPDPDRYFVAGIFHDIGKDLEISKQQEIVEQYFPDYKDFPKHIIHQFVGAYLALHEFKIGDEEILDAIKYHTTGNSVMNRVAKVIYASDKIEPTRGFDSTDLINSMKVSIDEGFITVLSANKDYFITKHIPYDNFLTKACMDSYLK